jgi:hypothetical protein
MKLYEYYGKSGFHTCIVTTFGVDFDAYEHVIFSRARGAGCHNNLLIADGHMLSLALDGHSSLPRHAGRLYSVTGARANGVFHPKVTLQLGRSGGRLIISSANITSAGLAGNLELAGVVECQAESSGERRLVASAFSFLSRFLDESDPGIRQQLAWMQVRSPWLFEDEASPEPVVLKDGSRAAFLSSGAAQGIARQFLDCIGSEKAERLIVLSPYWDDDLAELHFLMERTGAADTFVLIDQERRLFPADALDPNRSVTLVDFTGGDEKRFVHAKLMIVQTAHSDHVLYGSANCTIAALGDDGFRGLNEEASLYRALPRDAAVESLGLTSVLQSPPLDAGVLPALATTEPIPLADLAARFPGRFSCLFDTLIWRVPPGVDAGGGRLELLGTEGQALPLSLDALPSERPDERRFRLRGADERPSFARVQYPDGGASAPAVILVQDLLRGAVRDAHNKRMDVALAALDGETEIGLWLLETVNDLEEAETALRKGAPIKRVKDERRPDNSDSAPHAKLSYEAFVAGRQLRSETSALSRDSLDGTHFSYIRGFLNCILGLHAPLPPQGPETNSAALVAALERGDEVTDGAEALEQGDDFTPPPLTRPPPASTPEQEKAERERQEKRRLQKLQRSNREQLIKAVAEFQLHVAQKANGQLTSVDLLRLRAMLMVTLAGGWDGVVKPSNPLQVLPPSGDMEGAWPRLLGKCLFSYFGGASPAVRSLVIEDYYDQVPDDVLECWAGCLWSFQAIMAAASKAKTGEYRGLIAAFQNLGSTIYALTRLRRDEFFDTRIAKTFEALSHKFAKQLSLDPVRLLANHHAAIASQDGQAGTNAALENGRGGGLTGGLNTAGSANV